MRWQRGIRTMNILVFVGILSFSWGFPSQPRKQKLQDSLTQGRSRKALHVYVLTIGLCFTYSFNPNLLYKINQWLHIRFFINLLDDVVHIFWDIISMEWFWFSLNLLRKRETLYFWVNENTYECSNKAVVFCNRGGITRITIIIFSGFSLGLLFYFK